MDKYISLELAKKLHRAMQEQNIELESENYWDSHAIDKIEWYWLTEDWEYPAYDIIWDICIKHAKEFFGEEREHIAYMTNWILNYLRAWKKQEAEKYIEEHCIFLNKKNAKKTNS